MSVPLPRLVLLAATLVGLAHAALSWQRLPERVASHFTVSGEPDGWTSRGTLLGIYAALVLGMAGLSVVLSLVTARLPDGLINMPHKDYWLAPERRAATLQRVADRLDWLMAGTIVFLIWIFESVFRFHESAEPAALGGATAWAIWIFVGAVVLWTVELVLSFRRPDR